MINRSFIGFRTTPSTIGIDAWRVQLFCQAIGETNPIYWDQTAATAAGLPCCPLPPTFLKAIEGEHYSSAALLGKLKVPLRGVLHVEQSFTHVAPVYVGDLIEVCREVVDMVDKKGGTMTFITVDTTYGSNSKTVACSRQIILVRNQVVTT